MVKPIPDGFHAITPALSVRNGAQAIDFYKRALGAEEVMRIPAPTARASCTPSSRSATPSSC